MNPLKLVFDWRRLARSYTVQLVLMSCLLLLLASCDLSDIGFGKDSSLATTSPTDILYQGLSVEEANRYLEFDLILPEPMPSQFTLTSIIVHGPTTPASAATLEYAVDNLDDRSVSVYQTSGNVKTPDPEALQQEALDGASPTTTPLPSPSQSEYTIAGHPVLLTTIYASDGSPILTYSWDPGDLHVDISSVAIEDLTPADLEQLVASFVQSSEVRTN